MVQDIFKARADSFGETMTGGSGIISFKLPEYQRPYDWNKTNVDRLLFDCLNGLKRVASDSSGHSYTFLGTIILTSDESSEETFEGNSLLIVDGQQRLTTLLLLSCALFEAIIIHKYDIENVSEIKLQKWLTKEADVQLNRLYRCTTGQVQNMSATAPFPRMVRAHDIRAHHDGGSHYQSLIAELLHQFGQYCTNPNNEFSPTFSEVNSHLLAMYQHLRIRIKEVVYLGQSAADDQNDDFDPPVLARDEFAQKGCKTLFAKLAEVGQQSQVDKVASIVSNIPESEGLVRLLLFASYLIQSVVLTVVEAQNEDIGFDIFDALNTTGEPLTALETLKPHVVRFERDVGDEKS